MRIGVNGRFYGVPVWGVQRFAREVCRRLLPDPEVTLLLPAGVEPPSNGRTDPPAATVRCGRLPGHLWEQLELPWRARGTGCDVLLHLGGTAPLVGGVHVVAIHDVLPLTNPEWFGRGFVLWYRAVVRRAARRAAVVLTPSRWARDELVRSLGVPRERIHVVGQGVEPFRTPASRDEVRGVRERFDLPERYLLAVGDGDARKNVQFLRRIMDCWKRARPSEDPPHLVVVGARRARVHGLEATGGVRRRQPDRAPRGGGHERGARIRELGYVSDAELRALYTGARVFCFPSLGEGFGRPPLEAMACGTPAIVAPYGCAREILGDAALVRPLEPEAWITGITSLMAEDDGPDGQARRARVLAGQRHAQRFRWEDAVEAVREACRAAVEG